MENNYKQGSFLDHLTKGLYDAVVQAQALAENQHIEALKKFFDKDGKPLCMDIKIPNNEGKVSHHSESNRSSDTSAKYTVSVKGKQEKPEGLMKVLDMLNSSIGKGTSTAKADGK